MSFTESSLIDVDLLSDEFQLTLADNSNWLVDPDDLPLIASWLPNNKIRIELESEDDTYSYKLTNLAEEIYVRAMKIG